MGIAGADLNADGYPEYFLTSMADNKLQVLAEIPPDGKVKPSYADVAFKKGVTAHRPYMGADLKPSTAWHTQFEDVNNDGLADIFIAKGNVAKMKDFAMADPNNLLLQKADGTFMESGEQAGIGSPMVARGASTCRFQPRWPDGYRCRQPLDASSSVAQHWRRAWPLAAGKAEAGRRQP